MEITHNLSLRLLSKSSRVELVMFSPTLEELGQLVSGLDLTELLGVEFEAQSEKLRCVKSAACSPCFVRG